MIQTSAPTMSGRRRGNHPVLRHQIGDPGPEDVAGILGELQPDVRHVQNGEQPQVPGDDEPDELVEAELGPLVEAALERHRSSEPDRDDRGGQVEQEDGNEPEDDVRRPLLRRDADPLQPHDEEDLREDEVPYRQFLAQVRAACPDGVLFAPERGRWLRVRPSSAPDSTTAAPDREDHGPAFIRRLNDRELVGELLDDPVSDRIRHHENVLVHLVEGPDVLFPVLVQPCDYFLRGGREMSLHHVDEGCARPIRVRLAEEIGDGDTVLLPFGVSGLLDPPCRRLSRP